MKHAMRKTRLVFGSSAILVFSFLIIHAMLFKSNIRTQFEQIQLGMTELEVLRIVEPHNRVCYYLNPRRVSRVVWRDPSRESEGLVTISITFDKSDRVADKQYSEPSLFQQARQFVKNMVREMGF
jgi:hypothetical protein